MSRSVLAGLPGKQQYYIEKSLPERFFRAVSSGLIKAGEGLCNEEGIKKTGGHACCHSQYSGLYNVYYYLKIAFIFKLNTGPAGLPSFR